MVDDGILYAYYDRIFSAFIADTGKEKWKFYDGGWRSMPIALTDREIYYIGTSWSYRTAQWGDIVYTLKRENGELRWKFDFHQNTYPIQPLTVSHGVLYVSTAANLYAFDLAKIEQLLAAGKRWWGVSVTSARRNAILSLLADGTPPQLEQILAILAHYEGANRYMQSDAEFLELKEIGKDALPVLIANWKVDARMKPVSIGVRDDIIQYMLMEFGDASIVPDLEEMLSYNGHTAKILARIQGKAAIPKLIEVLQASAESYRSHISDTHRYDIMKALAMVKAKEAVPILSQRFADAEDSEKSSIARYLGDIGHSSAIPPLQDALRQAWKESNYFTLPVALSDALCKLGDKMGIEGLVRILEVSARSVLNRDWTPILRRMIKDTIGTLIQYTGQDFGSDLDKPEEHRREIAKKYRAWWDANKDKLIWSAEQRRFVFP